MMDANTQLVVEALEARSRQFMTAAMELAMGVAPARQARRDVRADAVKVLDLLIDAGKLKGNADALARGYLTVTAAGEFTRTTPPPTQEETMDDEPGEDTPEATTETVDGMEVDLLADEVLDDDETSDALLADVEALIQEGAEPNG